MSQNRGLNLELQSLALTLKDIIRVGLLLTIFASAFIFDAAAQDQPPNLSGEWFMESQGGGLLETFSQEGSKIKAVMLDVDAAMQHDYGFNSGETNVLATVEGHTIQGKLNAHYAINPFKSACPEVWSYWADLELTLSPDGNTLEGRWKWYERNSSDCVVLKEDWIPIRFTRHQTTEITKEADRIRINLEGAILFDFDKYNLKPEAQAVLAQVKSTIIDQHPGAKLLVEGHTDNIGTVDHNQVLSERRAQSVANWLQGHGIAPSLVEVKGYGKSKPKYPNDTQENRYRNRRVEISVLTVTN